jgi:hypothetical protein
MIAIYIGNAIGSNGPKGFAPVNTVTPVISGTNAVGQTLTTTNGTWTGIPSPTYTYQWKRDGSNIGGATSVTYVLVEADADTNVTCEVTATNSIGSASATSNSLYIFTAEYKAVLDKALSFTPTPYTLPTTATQQKQNKLLKSMKADGVWAKLDVFYVFAQDGSAEFATLNWKNPAANQANITSSPTFVSNGGFTGNGTSSYIDTNFNPATQGVQYTQNNASRYFFTHAIGTGRFDGNTSGINSMTLGTIASQRINAGANNAVPSIDINSTANTKSIHRTSSTAITAYNSTTSQIAVQTSAAMASANQWILRSSGNYGTHTCAAYGMGASMISEHSAFIADWNTYKNSL